TLAETASFTLDACGVEVSVDVQRRADPGQGGISLVLDDAVIKPTMTVDKARPLTPGVEETYTFTIELEQMGDLDPDADPPEATLEAVYVVLPGGFSWQTTSYVPNSSKVSTDGGLTWTPVPRPALESGIGGNRVRVRWPEDHVPANPPDFPPPDPEDPEYAQYTGPTGVFSSDPGDALHYFQDIETFQVAREKHYLEFQVRENLTTNPSAQCSWVVLRPWGTVSGPQATILTGGAPEETGCQKDGMIGVTKVAAPDIIQPGIDTPIKYTISITNTQASGTLHVDKMTDYLPPGFNWLGGAEDSLGEGFASASTEGTISWIYDPDPASSEVRINHPDDPVVEGRDTIAWLISPPPGINAGETATLVFWALASRDVSGAYHNEVTILPQEGEALPQGFTSPEITTNEQLYTSYSWETGTVMVPSYDSEASADGMTIDANLIYFRGVWITSYQVK
ncbi:hypothetical protein LCGC14_2009020, partial [marine sediment metagenome]